MDVGFLSSKKLWLLRASWLAPPIFLIAITVPHLISGFTLESSFPVPTYLSMNVALPKSAYLTAESRLEKIDPRDGDSKIAEADADQNSELPLRAVMPTMVQGLSGSPASARGWMVLAELLIHDDPAYAGRALSLSFQLDRWDYWFSGRRVRDAAKLWAVLPNGVRKNAVEQARLLWTEPSLRPQLEPLMAFSGGQKMIARAFEREPDTLRALNRWRASVQRNSARYLEHE